jgi:hypothetical protein
MLGKWGSKVNIYAIPARLEIGKNRKAVGIRPPANTAGGASRRLVERGHPNWHPNYIPNGHCIRVAGINLNCVRGINNEGRGATQNISTANKLRRKS